VERRRNRRFDLFLPLQILRNGAAGALHAATTRNISSGGVLFAAEIEVDPGGAIEYVVTLSQANDAKVDLRCVGKVVRCHKAPPETTPASNLIAATLDRYEFIRTSS